MRVKHSLHFRYYCKAAKYKFVYIVDVRNQAVVLVMYYWYVKSLIKILSCLLKSSEKISVFTHARARKDWATATTYSISLAMQMWFYVCLQSSPHVCFNSIVIVCLRSQTFRNPFPLELFSLVFIFKLCRRFHPYPHCLGRVVSVFFRKCISYSTSFNPFIKHSLSKNEEDKRCGKGKTKSVCAMPNS